METLITLDEAKSDLNMSTAAICRLVKDGKVKSQIENGKILLDRETIDAWRSSGQELRAEIDALAREFGCLSEGDPDQLKLLTTALLEGRPHRTLDAWLDPVFNGYQLHIDDGHDVSVHSLGNQAGDELKGALLSKLGVSLSSSSSSSIYTHSHEDGIKEQIVVDLFSTRLGVHLHLEWSKRKQVLWEKNQQEHLLPILSNCEKGLHFVLGPRGGVGEVLRRKVAKHYAEKLGITVSLEFGLQIQQQQLIQLPLTGSEEAPKDILAQVLRLAPSALVMDDLPSDEWIPPLVNLSMGGMAVFVISNAPDADILRKRLAAAFPEDHFPVGLDPKVYRVEGSHRSPGSVMEL